MRGERPLAAGDGVFDDAVDVGFRQEAQEIDAARGDAGVGRERDHRHAALAGGRADDADRMRKQRPDDDLGALGERLLRRLLRAARGAAVVLDQELDVRAVEFGQRHLGRVLHRQRHGAGVAAGRQRQDQADPDRAGADRGRLLHRRGGRGGGVLALLSTYGALVLEQAVSKASRPPAQQAPRHELHRGLRGRNHGRFPRQQSERQCQSTLANRHHEDDRLTKWKG